MFVSLRIVLVAGLVVLAGCSASGQVQASDTPATTPPAEVAPAATAKSTVVPVQTAAPTPSPTPAPTSTSLPAVTVEPEASVDPDPNGILPAEVAEAVPPGFELLAEAVGDLNLDGRPDMAIVVRQPGDADFGPMPDDVFPPRPVLLFVADPEGSMQLVARGDDVALCGRCGGIFGDPFNDITIDHGTISVSHYAGSAWRWTHTPTFAYDIVEDDWVLTGIEGSSFHATDPDATFEDTSITDVDPVSLSDYVSDW